MCPLPATYPLEGPHVGDLPPAHSRKIDIFFVDGNGVVNVMWVVGVGVWQGPVGLTPPGTASPGSQIATARQTGNQIDMFFADGNGAVNVIWVVDVGAWQGPIVF